MASVAITILNWSEMLSLTPDTPVYDPDVNDIGYAVDTGGGSPGVYRGLLRFSLSTLPTGAVVTAASLALSQFSSIGAAGNIQDIYRTTKPWVSQQTSWNNYATGSAWETAGGDYDSTVSATADPATNPVAVTPITSDVTALVQAAYNDGDATLDLLVKARNEAPGVWDDTTYLMGGPGTTPTLTITYDLPGDLEAALKEYLVTLPGVAGVLGDRVYVDESPQGTAKPKAIISLSGRSHERHLTGGAGLARARVNITVTAATPEDRNRAAHAIKQALHGKPLGTIGTGANAIALRSCSFDDETANIIAPDDGGSLPDYERVLPFIIWHVESVPTFA